MEKKERLKFLGCEISKSSYETRTGVKGGPAKFTDKNGGIHTRNGYGYERIFTPSVFRIYAKDENENVKTTDLYKTIFHLFGKLTPQKKENYARNILTALVELGSCIGISNEGSKNFWIEDKEVLDLKNAGTILENFDTFQEPDEYF